MAYPPGPKEIKNARNKKAIREFKINPIRPKTMILSFFIATIPIPIPTKFNNRGIIPMIL